MKNQIVVMVVFAVVWVAAIVFADRYIPIQQGTYYLDDQKIALVLSDLEKLKSLRAANQYIFEAKEDFLFNLEQEIGAKLDRNVSEMLANIASTHPRQKTKYIVTIPFVFAFSAIWFLLIFVYYPIGIKRIKYLFWFGVVGGLISVQLSFYFNSMIGEIVDPNRSIMTYSHPFQTYILYLFAALNEEFWKFMVCYLLLYKSKSFQRPIDGLVLAMMVGLGFATFENIDYIINGGYGLMFVRSLLCIPGHMSYCGIWGYGLAEVKFRRGSYPFIGEIWPYVVLAAVVHFLYNYLVSSGEFVFLAAALSVNLIAILTMHLLLIRKSRMVPVGAS